MPPQLGTGQGPQASMAKHPARIVAGVPQPDTENVELLARSQATIPAFPPPIGFLAIGHLTVDQLATGTAVGGSVAYAAMTAISLGMPAGIVTVAGAEIDWPSSLPGIRLARRECTTTTSFENLYSGGRRTQRLLSLAEPVPPDAVPEEWKGCPIVHLAPVAHEIDHRFLSLFEGSLIGLTPQGLLRRWDAGGRVEHGRWDRRYSPAGWFPCRDTERGGCSGRPGFSWPCAGTGFP